jgi:hypothetical protein
VIDYSARSTPLLRQPVTIPGMLRGLSSNGALLYLVGYGLKDGITDGTEWLYACAYDGVASYLIDSHALPTNWPHAVLVSGDQVFVTRPEVDQTSARALETWRLGVDGKFSQLSERKLLANASVMQAVGDLLVVQEDAGLELFALANATDLALPSTASPLGCLGWNLETAAGSKLDGIWLPLDLYGVFEVQVKP